MNTGDIYDEIQYLKKKAQFLERMLSSQPEPKAEPVIIESKPPMPIPPLKKRSIC